MNDAYFWIFLGGALGTTARFWTAATAAALTGPAFPWGTLLINVLGSFVIGLFSALTRAGGPLSGMPEIIPLVILGICGGYTTFSSFSLQTLDLARGGGAVRAGIYIALSVVLCMASVWAGISI